MSWFGSWFGGDDETEREDGSSRGDDEGASQTATSESTEPKVDIDAPESPWATVLYPFPLGMETDELRDMLESREIAWEAVEYGGEEVSRIVLPERNIRVEHRDEPFPDEQMNRRLLPETFPEDHAYVAVEPEVSDPLEKRDMLRDPESYPSPWDENGLVRVLTAVVRGLLSMDATAIVLHRSNQLAVPSQQFLEFTDGAAEGDWRAVKGWLDIDTGGEEDELLRTEGLGMFGLPDLTVRVDHEEGWWRRQLQAEALDTAIATMVLENRPLGSTAEGDGFLGCEPLEDFRVPLGVELDGDADDLEAPEGGEHVSYRVELEDERLVLRSDGPPTVWETWAEIDREAVGIELRAYQAMFRYECHETLGTPLGSADIGDIEGMDEIVCDLYPSDEGRPAHLVSNGLGRRARPVDGARNDYVRVELAIRADSPAEALIDILANCAAGFELAEQHWGPADILEFEEPLHGFQTFLLAPLFETTPDEGPAIEVWQLVPMTEEEYAELSHGGDASEWLEARDGATGLEFAERWNTVDL